jgi:chromosome segregation ATPase
MSSSETLSELVTEFDPLSVDDWNLQFDKKELSKTPVKSLIDYQLPLASPNSVVKYTQKDLDNLKKDLEAKFNKEFEVAQLEIQEMEAHRQLYMGINKELEAKIQNLMNFDSVESEKKSGKIQKLLQEIQDLKQGQISLKKEQENMELKLKKTDLELEQEKFNTTNILAENKDILEKYENLSCRYENLKNHAQEKLDEANVEIAKTRNNYEKEITTLRLKLQRSELGLKNLERSLQLKEEENKELTGICDGLVMQMESMAQS